MDVHLLEVRDPEKTVELKFSSAILHWIPTPGRFLALPIDGGKPNKCFSSKSEKLATTDTKAAAILI